MIPQGITQKVRERNWEVVYCTFPEENIYQSLLLCIIMPTLLLLHSLCLLIPFACCLVWKDLIIHSVCLFNVFWPWLHKLLGGFLSSLYFNKIFLHDLNMLDTSLDSGYTGINKTLKELIFS